MEVVSKIEPELMTSTQLGEFLSVGRIYATEYCRNVLKIKPINIGRGGKIRLRWRRSEIMDALDALQSSSLS